VILKMESTVAARIKAIRKAKRPSVPVVDNWLAPPAAPAPVTASS
jgi:hypothetical protein